VAVPQLPEVISELEQQKNIKRPLSPDNIYQQIRYIKIMSITLDVEKKIKDESFTSNPVLDLNTLKLLSEVIFPEEDLKLMWILSSRFTYLIKRPSIFSCNH